MSQFRDRFAEDLLNLGYRVEYSDASAQSIDVHRACDQPTSLQQDVFDYLLNKGWTIELVYYNRARDRPIVRFKRHSVVDV